MPKSSNSLRLYIAGIVLAGSMVSCQPTHEERIKNTVKDYLKKQTPDTVDYVPKDFGEIDTVHLGFKATNEYQRLADTFKLSAQIYALRSKINIAISKDKKDSFRQELELLKENLRKRKKLMDEFKSSYDPRIVGFRQPHTYGQGDSSLQKLFRVDTAYKVVNSKPYSPSAE
jgi:hypothetical protein